MYKKLPAMFKLSVEIGDSKTELELADGTVVFCSATTRSGLRSESITFLYLDEFSWLQTPELQSEFWQANYPILESMSGGLCVSSTPNGKDLFYDLVQKGKDPTDPKWILLQINWQDVFERDEVWKAAKIKDLTVGGKEGKEVFAQEYDCSFEVITDKVRFFNQLALDAYKVKNPIDEWLPHQEYIGEPIKIYEEIEDQHFIIGIDISEGKGLNFSTMLGLSLRKKKTMADYDVALFDTRQSFNYMNAFILPDDFFDLVFKFIFERLNDMWYMIVEYNDVGRLFSNRFSNLLEEINSQTFSKKNEYFKDILIDKFEGDAERMSAYLNRRMYRATGKKGLVQYGFKTDRRTGVELKDNMKTMVDKKNLDLCDYNLLEEARLFEDKRGGEQIVFDNIKGQGHFDCLSALKFALFPFSNRDLIKDILNISPLREGNVSRESQFLEAIIGANSVSNHKDQLKKELQEDNMRQLRGEFPALNYAEERDLGNVTNGWKRRSLWRKR
jgi:hypothetical protein